MNFKVLEKYDYISFDLFDTLITRVVSSPSDVFDIVERVYLKNKVSDITNFKEKRIQCEYEARKDRINDEVTLDDIYNKLSRYYKKDELIKIKQLEKDIEISQCFKNKKISKYYDYCVLKNKKIIINSDMYLPKEVIEKILKNNGYVNNYKVYVSSDTGVQKATSKMYNYILKDLNISKKEIIHIGDNKYTDFLIPNILGIKAIKINKVKKSKSKNLDLSFLDNYLSLTKNKTDYFEYFGYSSLGPLLYGFSYWLKEELEKDKQENVFFLAREGKIFKDAFEIINDNKKIKFTYMYASRRSLMVPALSKSENNLLSNIKYSKIKIETLFKAFGLEINYYRALLKELNINKNDALLLNDKKLKSLINKISDDIYKNSHEEEKIINKYFDQINFKNDVSIVDIGWFGSMQNYLNILTNDVNIKGYYLGLNINDTQYKKGYLFNSHSKLKEYKDLIYPILEVFLTSDHGSTEKFKMIKDKIEPVLYEYEYKEAKEFEMIMRTQYNALKFIRSFNKISFGVININPETSFKNISKIGITPSKEDINVFKDFSLYDGKKIRLIQNRGIIKPKEIIKDFYDSVWKIGYLKSLLGFNPRIFRLVNKIYFKKNKL